MKPADEAPIRNLQASSSKLQRNTRPQTSKQLSARQRLVFGVWDFSGAWSLKFGVCLALLLAAALPARPQAPAAGQQAAIDEAIRRQANVITLRKTLGDAHAARARGDLSAAAKLYDDSWTLVEKIGSGVDREAQDTQAGLVSTRLELARAAQKRNQLADASREVNDVLRVDPANADALAFKAGNDKLLHEQLGLRPDPDLEVQARLIAGARRSNYVTVQNGKLLFEMGKLDEAEATLKKALKEDPQNQAAYYYLNLIKDTRTSRAMQERDEAARKGMVEVAQDWAVPTKRDQLASPNLYARTNLIFTGKGRQAIMNKLDRIHIDTVKYERLPLGEVISNLNDEAKKRDPERRGLNFIINPNVDTGAAAVGTTEIDPATGLPRVGAAPPEPVDLNSIAINIVPPLNDVRLADVLDAIIKVAERPIKYSVEEYAVVFSLKGHEPNPLYPRVFRVDPNTFYQGLQSVGAFVFGETISGTGGGGGGGGGGSRGGGGGGSSQNQISGSIVSRVSAAPGGVQGGRQGGGGTQTGGGAGGAGAGGLKFLTTTNSMEEVTLAAKNFFTALGVDLSPPKSIFFNDREGRLIVRATLQDLDTIDAAIQVLNASPPQVNIKAKFVEVSQEDAKALGFDWYLGNVLMNNRTIWGSGGTQPSLFTGNTAGNTTGWFPGVPASAGNTSTLIPVGPTDQQVTTGLRNSGSTLFTLTGILTDPQFRMVLHALEQRNGADILSSPEVTIISGRQAQMKAVEIQTIVTDFDFNQQVGGLGGGGAAAGGTLGR